MAMGTLICGRCNGDRFVKVGGDPLGLTLCERCPACNPSPEEQARRNAEVAERKQRHAEYEERFRKVIVKHLAALDADLSDFEQTTHGSLFLHGVSIDAVAQDVVAAFKEPTAFNISELSQSIVALLKERAKK